MLAVPCHDSVHLIYNGHSYMPPIIPIFDRYGTGGDILFDQGCILNLFLNNGMEPITSFNSTRISSGAWSISSRTIFEMQGINSLSSLNIFSNSFVTLTRIGSSKSNKAPKTEVSRYSRPVSYTHLTLPTN